MAEFRVNYVTTASGSLTVEAESEEEAVEIADGEGLPGLCAYCSGFGREWAIDLGDWQPDDVFPVDKL